MHYVCLEREKYSILFVRISVKENNKIRIWKPNNINESNLATLGLVLLIKRNLNGKLSYYKLLLLIISIFLPLFYFSILKIIIKTRQTLCIFTKKNELFVLFFSLTPFWIFRDVTMLCLILLHLNIFVDFFN